MKILKIIINKILEVPNKIGDLLLENNKKYYKPQNIYQVNI